MKSFSLRAALLGLIITGSVAIPSSGSMASAGAPSFSLESNGQPASDVEAGDELTSSVTSPVTQSGSTSVEMSSVWDANTAQLANLSDITAPEGWTLSYTTDGSSWGSAPSSASDITGVKAVGTVDSTGYTAPANDSPFGIQNVSSAAVGVVRPTLGNFQGGSGGDGWDVSHGLGNIYNVFHHQTYLGIDCHVRASAGEKCWPSLSGNPFTVAGHGSAARSASYVDEARERLWIVTGRNTTPGAQPVGFYCLDVSSSGPRACPNVGTNGFVQLGTTTYFATAPNNAWGEVLGDLIAYDGRLYTKPNDLNSPVLCLKLSTASGCSGQPFYGVANSADYQSPPGAWNINRAKRFGNRMYITANHTFFDCFDLSTNLRCTGGSWPLTDANPVFLGPIFAVTSNGGQTIEKICLHSNVGNTCYTTDGEPTTPVAGLPVTTFSAWDGWGENLNHLILDRYYYTNGNSSFGCWDFVTSASCAGYAQGVDQTNTLAGYVYAAVVDPIDAYCLWSNADNGANKIRPFNALTGTLGCAPASPTVDFEASDLIRRLPCTNSNSLRQWVSITLTTVPQGLSAADARLTVLRDGQLNQAVTNWADVAPSAQGVWDLSGLSVSASGTAPTFAVSWPSGTLTGAAIELQYSSDPAQLCVELEVQRVCPSGNGQHSSSTFPGTPVDIETTAVVAGSASSEQFSVSAAPVSGCLATLSGSLTESGSNAAVPDTDVTILTASGGALVSTTSAADGTYSIPNLFPGTYVVIFGTSGNLRPTSPAASAVLTANSTTTKDGTYDSSALRAPTIERTAYPNAQTSFVLAPSGGSGTWDSTATALIDPSSGQAVTQLSIGGQPSWAVSSGTSVESSGIETIGTYFAVYKVETTGGSIAHGLLKLTVIPRPPFNSPSTTLPPATSTPVTNPPSTTPPTPVTVGPGVLPVLNPGQSQVLEDGQPVPVVVEQVGDGQWKMSGQDFEWVMEVPAGDTPGSSDGVVTLISNRDVVVAGFGFLADTYVDVWMLEGNGSNISQQALLAQNAAARYLGAVLVDRDGTFKDPLPVPADVRPGPYTLQANGRSFDGASRTLNLGVQVLPSKFTLPVTGRATSDPTGPALLILSVGLVFLFWARRRTT